LVFKRQKIGGGRQDEGKEEKRLEPARMGGVYRLWPGPLAVPKEKMVGGEGGARTGLKELDPEKIHKQVMLKRKGNGVSESGSEDPLTPTKLYYYRENKGKCRREETRNRLPSEGGDV